MADAEGNIAGEYLVTEYDVDMKFIVSARGLTSGRTAQTTFTDGVAEVTILSPTAGSPASVTTLPDTVNVTFNYRTNGSGGIITFTINIRTGTTIVAQTNGTLARANGGGGATVSFPVSIPAGTANGSYAVDVIVSNPPPGTGSPAINSDTENNAVIINGAVNTNLILAVPSPSGCHVWLNWSSYVVRNAPPPDWRRCRRRDYHFPCRRRSGGHGRH